MMIHCTKQTLERYNIKDILTDEENKDYEDALKENEEPIFRWGAKLFYINGRKSLVLCHFESRYTIFIYDVLKKDLKDLGLMIESYVCEFYKEDPEMYEPLKEYFNHFEVYFTRIHDRRIMSALSRNIEYINNGYRFYEFVEDGLFDEISFNNYFMNRYVISGMNGKRYMLPKDEFKKLILEYYSN